MSEMLKKRGWRCFCYICLFLCICLNSLHLFRGDIFFHSDIARDFLVMDELITNHKLTLIGPKSGGITGVFHGPAWYYLSLPFFWLANGNPAYMGIFWFALYLVGASCIYFFLRKKFGVNIALLTITLWSSLTILLPQNFLQSTPAIFFTIPVLYFISNYLENHHWQDLVIGLFCLGMIIQFQMAFGVPVLLAIGAYLFAHLIKQHYYTHLLAFLILLLPLSTYILFDLRHQFLQTNAVWQYFFNHSETSFNFVNYLANRLLALGSCFAFLLSSETVINYGSGFFGLVIIVIAPFIYHRAIKQYQAVFLISYLMIFGFWLLTFPFKGEIHPYYFEMLLPLICLWLVFFTLQLPPNLKYSLLLLVISFNLGFGIYRSAIYLSTPDTNDAAYWKFYRKLVSDVIADSYGQGFGYYAWTPDLLSYPSKYAMLYAGKQHHANLAAYQKKPLTYLLIAKNDAQHNPWVNALYWREKQVRIDREPDFWWDYPDGFLVQKYYLATQEAAIEADANLINGLQFR